MHNLFLWDEPSIASLSFTKKNAAIHSALKAYRSENPINIVYAILTIFIVVLIPSALIAYYYSVVASVGWASLATFILNFRMAKKEAPALKSFLANVNK